MTTLTTAHGRTALPARAESPRTAPGTHVTSQGAAWLASASAHPRGTLALWQARPGLPATLPCGVAFDVVNVPLVPGRRILDLLRSQGPGCGPVAVHRGRMLLFAAPGTAHRLPALLAWEEWGGSRSTPAPLCHGLGDAVTVPPLAAGPGSSRWVVAPETREPRLPGPDALLWAFVRAARPPAPAAPGGPADIDFSFRGSSC